MLKTYAKIALLILMFSQSNLSIAQNNSNDEYFKALNEIQQLPPGAKGCPKASIAEQKKLMELLPQKDKLEIFGETPEFTPDGISAYGTNIALYKGDFNNDGSTQYMLVAEHGGTMRTDTIIAVYKLAANRLIKLNLDDTISNNILSGKDLSNFYMHMPRPIAYTKNNKTYLRFMNIPYQEYDKNQLLVCTYIWQNKTFTSLGPKPCIGYKK